MTQSADAYIEIPTGKTVFAEGDAGDTMYIIESGSIDLLIASRGKEAVASFGPGDFFGELSLLDDQPRPATAIARKPSRLLKIDRNGFSGLLQQNVEIAVSLLRTLALRHHQCESRLVSALLEGGAKKGKPANPAAPSPATRQSNAKPPPDLSEPSRTTIEPPAPLPPPKSSGGCVLRHAGGQVFGLDPALEEFLVGRPDPASGINPEVNLSTVDPTRSLSRRHAKLIRQGGLFFVREENKTVNGTFVNSTRIETGENVAIKPGDKLRFGAVEVEFSAA